jgi:hypothetical protein
MNPMKNRVKVFEDKGKRGIFGREKDYVTGR